MKTTRGRLIVFCSTLAFSVLCAFMACWFECHDWPCEGAGANVWFALASFTFFFGSAAGLFFTLAKGCFNFND